MKLIVHDLLCLLWSDSFEKGNTMSYLCESVLVKLVLVLLFKATIIISIEHSAGSTNSFGSGWECFGSDKKKIATHFMCYSSISIECEISSNNCIEFSASKVMHSKKSICLIRVQSAQITTPFDTNMWPNHSVEWFSLRKSMWRVHRYVEMNANHNASVQYCNVPAATVAATYLWNWNFVIPFE